MEDEFYMCQPPPTAMSLPSCASCCGIYNYRGHNREMVTGTLAMQTELMESWDGTDDDIERVGKEVEARRPPVRFEVIYNCPFAGFLDGEQSRVGCLLHPLHLGEDLRRYCRYGRRTCGEAKCTSYTYFRRNEARAVMAAAGDWYLYGLCINDIDLVKGFFELCASRLHAPVMLDRVSVEPALARAFSGFLALKEDWPFARDPGRYGKYYFVERNYNIYRIDYRGFGASRPVHDGVLLSLGSVIESRDEVFAAIEIIDDKVDAFLGEYAREQRASA